MRPYVDGEFTYQVGDLVVMGHFFEKVRRQGDYIIYKYFMPEYIYILSIQSFGGGGLDTSH